MTQDDNNIDHPTDLLLSFMDDTLAVDEKKKVANHLQACDSCRTEMSVLRNITKVLKDNKALFCPEPWELFDYVKSGSDPKSRLRDHLSSCELCRNEVDTLRTRALSDSMPDQTWNNIVMALPRQGTRKDDQETKSISLLNWLYSFLKVPALATAALATVIFAFLLYPTGKPEFIATLSSEGWDAPSKRLKLMSPETDVALIPKGLPFKGKQAPQSSGDSSKRAADSGPAPSAKSSKVSSENSQTLPKVVVVLMLDENSVRFSTEQIDSLYRHLKPNELMRSNFEFIPPRVVLETFGKKGVRTNQTNELLELMKTRLNADRVLLVSLTEKKQAFEIKSELFDVHNGQLLKQTTETGIPSGELPERLSGLSRF